MKMSAFHPVHFPSVFHHVVSIMEIYCHSWVSFALVLSCVSFLFGFWGFAKLFEYLMWNQEWNQRKYCLFLFWSWLNTLIGKPFIYFYLNRMLIAYCILSKWVFQPFLFLFTFHLKERLYFVRDPGFLLWMKSHK